MYSRYVGIPAASIARAEEIGKVARERVIQAVLRGSPLARVWLEEVTRCRAAWKDLDPDTYELALEEVRNLSQLQHEIAERKTPSKPWWRFC